MKKYSLKIVSSIALIIAFVVVSCNKDEVQAVGKVANSFKILSPDEGTTLSLNSNNPSDPAMTIKWEAADFGYSSSTNYMLQIINSDKSFDTDTPQLIFLGTYGEYSNSNHTFVISTTTLNNKLKASNAGVFGVTQTFKMRVFAYPYNQNNTTSANAIKSYSQVVSFTSNIYDPIDEAAKLYVVGNFGAASTFADWDLNTDGTSNSPIIYSALNNNIYEGFVYMNVGTPQFKLASPTSTDLNIKGVGSSPFTATSIIGVSDPASPFGSASPGSLLATTDLSTGNVISPPSPSASSYFIKVKWDTNQYVILKRSMSIAGTATNNIAKALTYVTDPTSPFYRMYVGENISLSAGSMYVQVKNLSSADGTKLERFGIDNTITTLINSDNSSAMIKNKLKFGAANFTVTIPGVYTIILDLRNSANYNLRAIKTN